MSYHRNVRILAGLGDYRGRKRLAGQLERWGFRFDIASNGNEVGKESMINAVQIAECYLAEAGRVLPTI